MNTEIKAFLDKIEDNLPIKIIIRNLANARCEEDFKKIYHAHMKNFFRPYEGVEYNLHSMELMAEDQLPLLREIWELKRKCFDSQYFDDRHGLKVI